MILILHAAFWASGTPKQKILIVKMFNSLIPKITADRRVPFIKQISEIFPGLLTVPAAGFFFLIVFSFFRYSLSGFLFSVFSFCSTSFLFFVFPIRSFGSFFLLIRDLCYLDEEKDMMVEQPAPKTKSKSS